ncbi:MAG: TlpA family protein disulfide reductase [Campylobacter sp.]|nr:TlpA family protein disulfide reductase [Campylobacter sp.]
MKKTILAIVVAMFLVGCHSQTEEKTTNTTISNQSYNVDDVITLKSVTGSEVSIVRTEGGFKLKDSDKILMIDIFATFCQPCKEEAPHLMDFQLNQSDDFMVIGLSQFEDVSNEHIIDNFVKAYNAYYFIANSAQNENEKIINQILDDINYQRALTIPFKVVYNKKGEIELLSNNENSSASPRKYYVGGVESKLLEEDVTRIINASK